MAVKVKFHENCLYLPAVYQGVNKLFGFSKGFNHMKNSRRIGWTSDNKQIILHYFDHVDGKFSSEEFRRVNVGEEVELAILDSDPSWFGYRLYPFFGGQIPAPRDMTIEMEWL